MKNPYFGIFKEDTIVFRCRRVNDHFVADKYYAKLFCPEEGFNAENYIVPEDEPFEKDVMLSPGYTELFYKLAGKDPLKAKMCANEFWFAEIKATEALDNSFAGDTAWLWKRDTKDRNRFVESDGPMFSGLCYMLKEHPILMSLLILCLAGCVYIFTHWH